MKKSILTLATMLSTLGWASVVTEMEYFWGADPGVGKGSALTASDGAWDSALEKAMQTNIAVPSDSGTHILNIRSKDKHGWGAVRAFPVYVEPIATAKPIYSTGKVMAMEFFWNTDPGEGKGTQLTTDDGDWSSALEAAVEKNVTVPQTVGHHALNIRSKDNLGVWGAVRTFPIYVEPAKSVAIPEITLMAMEYFCGEDPGVGSATKVETVQFTKTLHTETVVDIPPSLLKRGANQGGFRIQNRAGIWGDTRHFSIFVETDSKPFAPEIIGNSSVCNVFADSTLYKLEPEPDATYEWFVSGGTLTSFGNDSALVAWDTLATKHLLKCVGTNSFGVGDTATVAVSLTETPDISIKADGNQLSVTQDDTWKYQWIRQGVPIEGATKHSYWATEDGNYRVKVQTECALSLTSDRVNVIYDPDQVAIAAEKGVLSKAKNSFIVVPSIADEQIDKVFIHMPKEVSGEVRFIITDVLGNILDEQEHVVTDTRVFSWDLRNKNGIRVGSGSYLIMLQGKSHSKKPLPLFKTLIGVKK